MAMRLVDGFSIKRTVSTRGFACDGHRKILGIDVATAEDGAGKPAFLATRSRHAVRVAERVHVREIDDDEGARLLRIIRRGSGSVVTWRRAQLGV
ncbi:hypothetical protein ACFV2D_38000 [Streptomyces capillispiralis]|uniref:hypothetical protein n=1 Tax=Streptomyces capillispiralis TaxID=68182 RepID=UPI00369D3D20